VGRPAILLVRLAIAVDMLQKVLTKLESQHGSPDPPTVSDPFELVLFENVVYLLSDEKREAAFRALKENVGTSPVEILSASHDKLFKIAKLGGMLPEARVERFRNIAQIALQEFEGDLASELKAPLPKAKKALMKFPSIGEPGAEKILLFSRSHPVLGLDSNGMRVLLRIGYGEESKSYSTTYHSVRDAVRSELRPDYDWLIKAHQLLRRHGQEVCRRAEPLCRACSVKANCQYYKQKQDE
jgi:endonuclease III